MRHKLVLENTVLFWHVKNIIPVTKNNLLTDIKHTVLCVESKSVVTMSADTFSLLLNSEHDKVTERAFKMAMDNIRSQKYRFFNEHVNQ